MSRKRPIFYSAMMLTAVHLLLRFAGTSFQVYLSGKIGASGIGLLQLTMSVGNLAMVAGIAGIRTATMYLTAEELGKGSSGNVPWVLSGCIRYSLVTGGTVAAVLLLTAPYIAKNWISDLRIIPSIRLFAGSLCVNCLCGVMTGYFTAADRIGTLAAVEVVEQLFSMAITILCLSVRSGTDPGKACESVIMGSSAGACLTLAVLTVLRLRQRCTPGPRIQVTRRLTEAAVPLALSDILRTGIVTLENMMVPKRLALANGVSDPLAEFGVLTGMVFPVLMFPACILHALADLMIPELARCSVSRSGERIRYLAEKTLGTTLIYALCFGGWMFLAAEQLCARLYQEASAGPILKLYALLIPMLYCDSMVDSMTKGLGQQKICVRYNIITSVMDIVGLFLLLPSLGMKGYFISFLITHLINFLLSLRRLRMITALRISPGNTALSILSAIVCIRLCTFLPSTAGKIMAYPVLLGAVLYLLGTVSSSDLRWMLQILGIHKK